MSAVRILVLLIAFWLLVTAIPCYAAAALPYGQTPALSLETVCEGNANSLLGNLEPIRNSTQIGNASETAWDTEAVYSIDAHVRNPVVNPGDTVEIEVYLSGYGIPEKNKLMMIWSSPYVIDKTGPGNFTFLTNYDINTNTITWGFIDLRSTIGNTTGAPCAWLVLPPVFFEPAAALLPKEFPDTGLRMVMGETNWNDEPPILVKLKTSEVALSGDYQVKFTFTYGNETNLKQDYESVEFHITSRWERNQQKYSICLGVGIPIVLFVAGIILRKRQVKNQKKRKH